MPIVPEIEQRILELLQDGPKKQVDMAAAFPLDRYIDFGHTIRDMDRRGLVAREKCGRTRMVALNVKK